MRAGAASAALALGLAAAACRPAPEAALEVPVPAGATERAVALYELRCAACHGVGGRGDGPRAAGFTVEPPDFTDAAWRAATSDAHAEAVVLRGSAAAGLSNACPKNVDLQGRPELVAELLQLLRSFPE